MIDNNNFNTEADFWFNEKGINIFPLDNGKVTYENWSKYQEIAIPDEIYEEWKQTGRFTKGIILMPGKVWRGENKEEGLYFVGIDFDKELGLNEFCNIIKISIDELKQKFIVEQHEGDTNNSFHVYFYSEIPFTDKSPDTILGLEIKSNCKGLMCATPSYHYKTKSRWEIKGTNSPIILNSEQALKLMSDINEICKKYNVKYLEQYDSDNNINNNSSGKLPEPLRQLVNWLEIPLNFQFRIHEGSRHSTLISFANALLFKYKFYTDINNDQLKGFFYEVNDKLCVSEPLPEDEIKTVWRDALKHSEEKTSRIKIEGDDENDASSYKSQVIIPLEFDDQLLEIVETFVYDIQKNSIDCQLNSKYKPGTRIIIPINIKQWPNVHKTCRNQCKEKGIDEMDTSLLLESLDKNVDKIIKYYLESHRKSVAALAEAEERRKQRLELIKEGTEFVMTKYKFATIEESKDILFYDSNKGVYVYGGEIEIEKAIEKKYGYQLNTANINEIKDFVTRKIYIKKEKFDSNIDIINVKNGLLNGKTGELLPHTPDYYSLNQKPIKYNPNAKPTKFLKFLEEVLYPQDIQTAIEIIAYTFIRQNLFEYWFVLIGGGANGKNVFVGILSHLHGRKNISNIPLVVLDNPNHRFALAQLENKDINVDTELSARSYNDLSTLKKLTGRQPIMLERKGKDPYEVESWAKLFFNCNELPISSAIQMPVIEEK
jgi:hypothetical protein